MGKNLVIVESPAKARTLEKFLGKDFSVLASYGHVRDIPSKKGMVAVDDDFEPRYALIPENKRHVDAIKKARDAGFRVTTNTTIFKETSVDDVLEMMGYLTNEVGIDGMLIAPGMGSFLLLGDGSKLKVTDMKTLENFFAGVDLLTLSACETGLGGKNSDGQEVEGFGVLAQRQGAPRPPDDGRWRYRPLHLQKSVLLI